jgi:ATP-dependent DNA helicase DinG
VARLGRLVGDGAEVRQGQRDYSAAAAEVFAPRATRDRPNLLLAEAGTGIGKTLGYLAPASLWAERADGAVWVSTYTKALQRQLDREGARLFPDAAERRKKIVIRKGRENYLCLLNLEDALQGGFSGRAAILAQLVARWAAYSKDGDMVGGDLPGWLVSLFRRARITGNASSSGRRGRARRRTSSSPTTPWSWSTPPAAATSPTPRPGSSSTRVITCSRPPIRPSPRR